MLKAQLRSKVFQLDRVLPSKLHETVLDGPQSTWRDVEDILTSDFFGVLDYLPRKPFLASFVAHVALLNPQVETPAVDGIDWDASYFLFWPRIPMRGENTEPDVVIVTGKWVLVIEVKLDSALGTDQPQREFAVGKILAEDCGLSVDYVYYLVVARTRLEITSTFPPTESEHPDELAARTCHMKWHEVVALVESWVRGGCDGQTLAPEQGRMLGDLLATLRKRRSISLSGYAFANVGSVDAIMPPLFCPPSFVGFLRQTLETATITEAAFLSNLTVGFATIWPTVDSPGDYIFLPTAFGGFAHVAPEVSPVVDSRVLASDFEGFLNMVPNCTPNCGSIFGGIPREINRGT